MTWFKVDDKFWSHRKTRSLTDAAVALWVRAGSYCGDHLTDGVIEHADVEFIGGDKGAAEELVRAGLWLHHVKGYQFHDWEKYQPSRSKVEREREQARERMAKKRSEKSDSSSLPVPTRPSFAVTSREVRPNTDPTPIPPNVSERMAELREIIGGSR